MQIFIPKTEKPFDWEGVILQWMEGHRDPVEWNGREEIKGGDMEIVVREG